MVRISAIFIAACMVLIAGSLGFVVYLRFGFTGAESALVALGTLTALAVYNAIAARKRDRLEVSNQLANLARGSGDLARQLAEFGRRLNTMEVKVDSVIDRALATAQPLVRRNRGTLDAGQAAGRIRSRRMTWRSAASRRPPQPPPISAPAATGAAAAAARCRGIRRSARCGGRSRRRSSARSPPSPGSTATASLPRSQAPSKPPGSIFTCSPW